MLAIFSNNKLKEENMGRLPKFKIILFSFFLVVFLSLSMTATSCEVENQSEFSYDTSNMTVGPANWGQFHPDTWYRCGNGTMQSPIDLKNATNVTQLSGLQTLYMPSSFTLENRGHDVSLKWEGNPGYIEINGTRYNLDQCHWHTPSEHTIDGQRYDLEIHCVHESNTSRTAVTSILYEIGLVPDPFLELLTAPLIALANGSHQASAGIKDPRQIPLDSSQYFRYIGSLTTPPCCENVTWTVVKQVKSVSSDQVQLLQEAVGDGFEFNARPLQALNNRPLLLYKPF